jgi:RNA polymerase sigma-70 factor (ECF subfamily)
LEPVSDAAPARGPKGSWSRSAINVAGDRRRNECRRLSAAEVASLLDAPGDFIRAANIPKARLELEALERALAELPARRRKVLMAAVSQNISDHEIAALLRINTRTVESDLNCALKHCASRLGRKLIRRSGGTGLRA